VLETILGGAIGALISAITLLATGASKRGAENRDTALRLTIAVETVASRLEELHEDFKSDRKEVFGRLNGIEQRLSGIEARNYK
jgi:gas vesicle protein